MNPNQFTTTSTRDFGSRLMGAIIGVPVGLALIFGSCVMLYWNEGRTDFSKIATKSIPVQASQVDQSKNGKFVSVTGSISSGQNIGDGAYLRPGSYVAVQRTVEEYAWEEQQQTQAQNNTGGSQTTTTTYTYKQKWVDQPADSTNFKYPQGHQNPPKPLDDTLVRAASANIGAYSFDPQTIKLPSMQDLALNNGNTLLNSTAAVAPGATATPITTATAQAPVTTSPLADLRLASPQYIYGGNGSLESPQTGDIRISYKALPSGTTVTVFGQLNNGSLEAYTDPSNRTLYDLLLGDRQTAIATLHSQYEKITWILRVVGILLIWVGLMMLLAPLDTLLDFIPFVGEIGGMFSGVITFPIALVLGGTVIIIGYTLHHLVALLIGVPLIFIIWVGIFKLIKKARNIPKRGSGGTTPPSVPQQPISPYNPSPPMPPNGSLFTTNPSAAAQPTTYSRVSQQPVNNPNHINPPATVPNNPPAPPEHNISEPQ